MDSKDKNTKKRKIKIGTCIQPQYETLFLEVIHIVQTN